MNDFTVLTQASALRPAASHAEAAPLLYVRREYLQGDMASTRTTCSKVLKGTTSGLDNGPDDGDW